MVRTYGANNGSLGGVFAQNKRHGDQPVDYNDLLNQKRMQESQYRNSADPFVIAEGGLKASSQDTFFTRVNDPPQEDFGLGNELKDLSGVLSRIQQNMLADSDDSGLGSTGFESYPQSASNNRKSWSAPNGGDGTTVVGPGLDPNFGVQLGALSDPLQHLHQPKSATPSVAANYNPSVYTETGKRGGTNDREGYLRELEQQMAEQKARKEKEHKKDWWEKNPEPPFQVNQPQRPHPSMNSSTADQLPDPKASRKQYENELRMQMELKKAREIEEKQKVLEEEKKLERRIQEQQDRMRLEFEEEQAKKKAKEDAKTKRQEQLAKRQIEIQKEAEQKKKEESERRFQERRGTKNLDSEKQQKGSDGNDGSRSSTPATTRRSDSPPLPALRNKGGSSGAGSSLGARSLSSASVGGLSSGTEDEQAEVLNQLSTMKNQLDKLDGSPTDKRNRRQSQVWEGLAEV